VSPGPLSIGDIESVEHRCVRPIEVVERLFNPRPGGGHTSACRAQPHPLPAGGLLHLLPAGVPLHLQPAGVVPPTATTAGLSRPACRAAAMRNRTRQTRALLPSGTSCRSKPATYPRRPGRSRTARTIPTVPCPSCQTASRRYAHSHRHPATRHLSCQSGRKDLRIVADRLGWRPPPQDPPDKLPASRYSPAETTKVANRHPLTHSAATSPCPPALLPTGSTASERGEGIPGGIPKRS